MGRFDCDWSSLISELLEKISEALTVHLDYIRFRAVCRNWRSAAPKIPQNLPCQVPWLMLSSSYNNDTPTKYSGSTFGFFSLPDNRVYNIDLPKAYARGKQRCFCSSQGWLCFVENNTFSISILNPLTKVQIQLPPIHTVPEMHLRVSDTGQEEYHFKDQHHEDGTVDPEYMFNYFFEKLILSENPTSENYIAMIMYGEDLKLAFCRAGDHNWWAEIELSKRYTYFDDAIFHKGQFYCVCADESLITFNPDPYDPKENKIAGRMARVYDWQKKYLVEVFGEVMMVMRNIGKVEANSWFHVYRFTPTSKDKWIRVTNLGEYTLFLGSNHSFSLSAKDFPEGGGFKPNCIYYADRFEDSYLHGKVGSHAGIYNMEDGRVEPLPCNSPLSIWPPPIWITPSLCC